MPKRRRPTTHDAPGASAPVSAALATAPAAPQAATPRLAPWPERLDLSVILALALLVRLVLLLQLRARDPFYAFTVAGFDQRTYQLQAADILGGDLLLRKWGLFYYTPLYSYFCAATYSVFGRDSFGALHLAQAAMGAGCAAALHALARTYLSRAESLAAGAMAALCPAWLFYEQQLLVEGLVLGASLGSLLLLRRFELASAPRARIAWLFAAGCVSAISYIGRGSFALVVLAIAAWLALRPIIAPDRAPQAWKRAALSAAFFMLGFCAGVLPLAARNLAVTGRVKFGTANGAANLYLGNAADSRGFFEYSPRFLKAHQRAPDDPGIYMRMMREDLRDSPGRVFANLARKGRYFFNAHELSDNASLEFGKAFSFLLGWSPLTPRLLFALGLLGFALSLRRVREESLLWVFAAAFAASIILVFPTGRYRIPIYAPMILMSARAAFALVSFARARRFVPLAASCAALIALWLALAPFRKPPTRLEDCKIYLLAAMQQKNYMTAGKALRVAERDHPAIRDVAMFRFWWLVETEKWDEAREFWTTKLGGPGPVMAEAYAARARLLLHDGDAAQARATIAQLAKADPKFRPPQDLLDALAAAP